ncbi:hypothetical protein ACSBR2_032843 [Camellia fascicularis]
MSGAASLDMTLDDLIKNNKKSGGGGGGGGGGGNFRGRGRSSSGPGPARRFPNRGANRPTPYATAPKVVQAPDSSWKHDMFGADQGGMAYPGQAAGGGRASSIETGTKLYISNLDYGVSNEDIKVIVSFLSSFYFFFILFFCFLQYVLINIWIYLDMLLFSCIYYDYMLILKGSVFTVSFVILLGCVGKW